MGTKPYFLAAASAGWMAASISLSAAESAPKTAALTPQVFPVGKWAEGLVVAPEGVWVAESGQRSIALVDGKTGKLIRRVQVGRLPVDMARDGAGVVSTLVQTDKRIWRQPPRGVGKAINGLPGCPEALAQGGSALWVLTAPSCDSTKATLVRVDLRSGRQAQTRILGEWGQALAFGEGKVYVAHARPPALDIVDAKTLEVRTIDPPNLSLWSIASTGGRLFAGGRLNDNTGQGVVASFDPQTGAEQRRQMVDQTIMTMAADETSLVAVGESGRIYVFKAETLAPVSIFDLSTGPFKARAAAIASDTLYLTSQSQSGENGAVLAVEGWRAAQ
jgi:outer membrane protein assembly factor BamB